MMPGVKMHKRCRSISSSGACASMNLPVRPASASQTRPGGSPFCFATTCRVDRRRIRPSHPTCRAGFPGAAARASLISKHSGCAGHRRSRHHVNQEDRQEPGAAALRPRAARTTLEPPDRWAIGQRCCPTGSISGNLNQRQTQQRRRGLTAKASTDRHEWQELNLGSSR